MAKEKKKKRKKINKLTLEEIEENLKAAESSMGGITSQYTRHLIQRKEYLLKKKK